MMNKILFYLIITIMQIGWISGPADAKMVLAPKIIFDGSVATDKISIVVPEIVFKWPEIDNLNAVWKPDRRSETKIELPPTIVVIKPGQGNTWFAGKRYYVQWKSNKVDGAVRLFLIRGKGLSTVISSNRIDLTKPSGVSTARGSRRITVPKSILPGEYRILVQSVNDPKVTAFSDYFMIKGKLKAADLKRALQKDIGSRPPSTVSQIQKKHAVKPPDKTTLKMLKLISPKGMKTWQIGDTLPVKWVSSGIDGRVKIILTDHNNNERVLTPSVLGVNAGDKSFNWKIGKNIKPGSMYTIHLKTVDGTVTSKKSGGFNIKMKLDPTVGKNKTKSKLKERPKGGTINLTD